MSPKKSAVPSAETKRPERAAPKPRKETAKRREDILRAAMETFGAKGYNKGSLVDVADRAGMTHAGVLHHFGSKDNLLLEVLLFRDKDDVAELEGAVAPEGMEFFHHLVRTVKHNMDRPGIVQTYAVLSAESVTDDHPAQDWFRNRFDGLRDQIRDSLRMICDPDAMPSDAELNVAASALIGVMDGLQVQWLLEPDRVDLAEATTFAIDAIITTLLAGPARSHTLPEAAPGGLEDES